MPAQGGVGGVRHLTVTKDNLEGPDILSVPLGAVELFVANEEVAAFSNVSAVPSPGGGVAIVFNTTFAAPISPAYAGTTVKAWGRFARKGESPTQYLADLFARVAGRFPRTLSWSDKRPIGVLFLASHGRTTPFNPLNPRYWRIVKPSVDVTTPAGRAEFQTRLLEEASKTVTVLKEMHAQGVIVWDIEGQQYIQPVSYVGDPRQLAPEVQGVVDEFFKRFTSAGLRCGVTLRPQRFVVAANGEATQQVSEDPQILFQTLDAKIQYARNRWGCTLFYIDSTGDPGWPIDASVFRQLAAKHPDVLLSPEQKTLLDYAWTAPYCDFRNGECPSDEARWIYPKAFSVIYVGATPLRTYWQSLVERVKAGDVLAFPGWIMNPTDEAVVKIYQEASEFRGEHE
jgi:hypothetical protein